MVVEDCMVADAVPPSLALSSLFLEILSYQQNRVSSSKQLIKAADSCAAILTSIKKNREFAPTEQGILGF